MLRSMKKVIRLAMETAGYDIVRVKKPMPVPCARFDFTDLHEFRRTTDFIPGMISPEAADLLYGIAVSQDVEGDILEIGSWQGKSTSYLARAIIDSGNGHLFAVDHFMGNVGKENCYFIDGEGDLKTRFERNMRRLGLQEHVTLLACHSEKAFPSLAGKVLRFLFIDGDHTYEGVRKDIGLFCPLVRAGGMVVFDDYNDTSPGVVRAVEEWVDAGRPRILFVKGNMLFCKL